jgi:hypothetical protein
MQGCESNDFTAAERPTGHTRSNSPTLDQHHARPAALWNGAECDGSTNNPVIVRFRAALSSVQASELERLYRRLPELDDQARIAISQFADRVVATMLDPPLESLRNARGNGSQQRLLEALKRLFQLQEIDIAELKSNQGDCIVAADSGTPRPVI